MRARLSTRSIGPAAISPAITGTETWSCRPPPAGRCRGGSRSSAMPPARSPGPTATSFPRRGVDAVEIDAELTDIGRRFFDLRNPRMRTFAEDARPWLERSAGGYDAIMVDAYRQPYIPFYLATREFFALARDRLAPGGVVIVNVGHPEGNDDLERVLGRTMAAAFPQVLRDPIEPTNTLLVAKRRRRSRRGRLRAHLGALPAPLRDDRAPRRPARWPRVFAAARSTPTTGHRSSGSSTPRCWGTPRWTTAAGRGPGSSPARWAGRSPSRSTSRRCSGGAARRRGG